MKVLVLGGTLGVIFPLKESLITFSLSRLWRWTAAPRYPQMASLFPMGQSLPSPLFTKCNYIIKFITFSHHSSSRHICSTGLPFPSPTHGHCRRCTAFCGVHPSHTHHGSSVFPTSRSHWRCGPLSMAMYTSPLIALEDHRMYAGALGCIGCACLMPAGVAMSGLCNWE